MDEPLRYVGYCCREWIMSFEFVNEGKCGLCGEHPEFLRWWSKDEDIQ